MSQADDTQKRLIETYRKKAKHYDITSRLYPAPGYPQRAQRLRAVQALGLRAGDSVIDIACGTGLNFSLIEAVIGPGGRIVGVDLTDAMLVKAQDRIATNGWRNISLVQADAAGFDFPAEVDAILSTYALTQVPESAAVIARGAAALSEGGRWAVLDLKVPDNTPEWLARLGTAMVRRFAGADEWIMRRPWEAIRAAMREELADPSWTELFFGTAFLAAGSRGPCCDVRNPPERPTSATAPATSAAAANPQPVGGRVRQSSPPRSDSSRVTAADRHRAAGRGPNTLLCRSGRCNYNDPDPHLGLLLG